MKVEILHKNQRRAIHKLILTTYLADFTCKVVKHLKDTF